MAYAAVVLAVMIAVEVPRVDAHATKLRAMSGRCDGWMGLRCGKPPHRLPNEKTATSERWGWAFCLSKACRRSCGHQPPSRALMHH